MTNWLLIAVLILSVGCIFAGLGWLWSAAREGEARDRAHEAAQEAWDQARRQYVEDLRREAVRRSQPIRWIDKDKQ